MILDQLVSVGIPTYERPNGLKKCLNAIRNQTYRNLEIIISDNASENPSTEVYCLEVMKEDDRVKYFKQISNIGPEENFNFVLRKSSGKMFMWVADDDWLDELYIEKCVKFLQNNSEYHHVSGKTVYLKNSLPFKTLSFPDIKLNHAALRAYLYYVHVWKNGVFYGLFKVHDKEKIFLSSCPGADWSFMARQCFLGKIKVLDEINYYRDVEGISSSRNAIIKRWKLNYIKEILFEFYSIYVITIDTLRYNKTNFFAKFIFSLPILIILSIKLMVVFIRKRFDPSYF